MGLFGKRSSAAPSSATGNGSSSSHPRSAGKYVAPLETPPLASSAKALQLNDLEQASPDVVPNKAMMAMADNSVVVNSPANVLPVHALGEDDFTVDDKTIDTKTFDDRTFKTEYTAPTLRTMRSDDDQSKDSAFTITRNGEYLTMNGFANGHLMRWKFAAEEGPAFIRFPAVLLALAVIGTSLYPIVVSTFMWTPSTIICASHTCITASLILILEGRVVLGYRAPTSFRARVRAVVTRYLNVFRLLWGRGILYIFVGTMNMTIDHPFALYTGLALVAFGFIAIGSGAHASYNLDKMKTSLTDEAYLWSKFDAQDADSDNHIDLNQFAELLWSLGLEFDDAYTYKAFAQIDGDAGALITFEQFRDWWIVTQHRGRMLRVGN